MQALCVIVMATGISGFSLLVRVYIPPLFAQTSALALVHSALLLCEPLLALVCEVVGDHLGCHLGAFWVPGERQNKHPTVSPGRPLPGDTVEAYFVVPFLCPRGPI